MSVSSGTRRSETWGVVGAFCHICRQKGTLEVHVQIKLLKRLDLEVT